MSDDPDATAPDALIKIVALALEEDLGPEGDITSRAIFNVADKGAARVITRESCTVSGIAAAAEVCRQTDPALIWLPLVEEGQPVPAGAEVARLEGGIIPILAAERTVLNFLSRLSGIATLTATFVKAVLGTGTRIAATRKTSPGMRLPEKEAVVHGGGELHRIGLYDAILIKDNHLAAIGGISSAIDTVRKAYGLEVWIEVEADTRSQCEEALIEGADRVLLDNMTPESVRDCVLLASEKGLKMQQAAEIEASGGIDLGNVRAYAEAGADVISVGALTRSAPGIDFSLEVE
ncbi:MAG: carboxylating nicotinate-nucleotide diphosphorylase [Thermoleophilia bacterium]